MKAKAISGIVLTLLLISMLTLAFNIKTVKAVFVGNITIRADGSVAPSTAPISTTDKITYTFTGNVNGTLFVNRSNIIVDGARYILQGNGGGNGVIVGSVWTTTGNVIIKNMQIRAFQNGFYMETCSYITVCGNNITGNGNGICFGPPQYVITNCYISGNNITNNGYGINLSGTNVVSMKITGNNITNNYYGIYFYSTNGHTISGNIFKANQYAIYMNAYVSNDIITENNFIKNNVAVCLSDSSLDTYYHNNFINNTKQVGCSIYGFEANVWDDGYPDGGNYWSNYNGTDLFSGPYQNVTGSDGIGDTPCVAIKYGTFINTDRYPLMKPVVNHVAVTNIALQKTVVGQGYRLNVNVTVLNHGNFTQTFTVTLYANTTSITSQDVTLTRGTSTIVTFTWSTTGFAYGNYTISAKAAILPSETNTADNTRVDGTVFVTIAGDVNSDGVVNSTDFTMFLAAYGTSRGQPAYNANCDFNNDGKVDATDFVIFLAGYGFSWK